MATCGARFDRRRSVVAAGLLLLAPLAAGCAHGRDAAVGAVNSGCPGENAANAANAGDETGEFCPDGVPGKSEIVLVNNLTRKLSVTLKPGAGGDETTVVLLPSSRRHLVLDQGKYSYLVESDDGERSDGQREFVERHGYYWRFNQGSMTREIERGDIRGADLIEGGAGLGGGR